MNTELISNMESDSVAADCREDLIMADGPSDQPHVPRWSVSEFPHLSCGDSIKKTTRKRSFNPHSKSQRRTISFQDENNNRQPAGTTTKSTNKKFKPAEHLWCFSYDAETTYVQMDQLVVDEINANFLRELEEICWEYRPEIVDGQWRQRLIERRKGKRSVVEGIRARLDIPPPSKTKRLVNFRILTKKNKRRENCTDNREKRQTNSNRKLASNGMTRGVGNTKSVINVEALTNAMPSTAAQQRAPRKAKSENSEVISNRLKKSVRPTSMIKGRRKVRWKNHGTPPLRKQEPQKFELHQDNIAFSREIIKNEDDLWQLMNIQHRELTPEDYDLLLQLDESIAPKTVSEETLSCLKVETVDESKLAGILTGQLCSICIEEYSVGQNVKYLPCDHFYHEKCIDNWLTYCDSKCPLDGLEINR